MKKHSDKFLANMVLKKRQANSSIFFLFKLNLKYQLLIIGLMLLFFGLFWLIKVQAGVYLVFSGFLAGAVVRDFGWFRSIKKTWSFQEKITDWQKVEELAGITDDKT